ncbi:MAG: citrate transporter [Clostridiales bacterium]|nr:citrate transporter [Clostridiales bacterium]
MQRASAFIRKNVVFCIAVFAALVTCFFVPPDKEYLTYFDWKTLACLFLTLAVVCALRNIRFFTILSKRLVILSGNLRTLFFLLICITFVGSMLIANDMALITFLPLGYYALKGVGQKKKMAYLFILQNIAANLGGLLTPFGNPQNLYIYSYFNIPTMEFCSIMLPLFVVAVIMLAICCFFVKPTHLLIANEGREKLNRPRAAIYLVLFIMSILIIFNVIKFWIGLIVIPAVIFIMDKKALAKVDYSLLGTFFFFFVFAGNLTRISAVNSFFSHLLEKDTLLVSIISCQGISNVPSAILLSKFTTDYRALLMGVNIGGTGTLIASLASLITFNEYKRKFPDNIGHYMLLFTVLNVIFLVVMTILAKFVFL